MINDYSTLKYTICFIKQGNKLLMLNRNFKPVMGLWNGVGGKVNAGETPLECILREVYEETGIELEGADPKGIVSWKLNETDWDGMYVFLAELTDRDCLPETPINTVEGILDWKEIAWVLHPNNSGVAENIPYFLTSVLNDQQYFDHQCFFEKGRLVNFESILLPDIDFCYQPVQSAI